MSYLVTSTGWPFLVENGYHSSESPPSKRARGPRYLGKDGLGSDLGAPDSEAFSDEVGPDSKVLDFILSKPIIAIRDDYNHWKQMKYIPESGKPLWISLEDDVQHIFLMTTFTTKRMTPSSPCENALVTPSKPSPARRGSLMRIDGFWHVLNIMFSLVKIHYPLVNVYITMENHHF